MVSLAVAFVRAGLQGYFRLSFRQVGDFTGSQALLAVQKDGSQQQLVSSGFCSGGATVFPFLEVVVCVVGCAELDLSHV